MKNVVFFSGLPSSGQDILSDVLKTRFNLQVLPQSLDVPVLHLAKWMFSSKKLRDEFGPSLLAKVSEAVWNLYKAVYADKVGTAVVADVSHQWLCNLDIMRAFLPGIKIVAFVRHLATLCSVTEARLLDNYRADSVPETTYDRFVFALSSDLSRALDGIRNMIDAGTSQNIYLVKYEDIVVNPTSVAMSLAKFLDLDLLSIPSSPVGNFAGAEPPLPPPRVLEYLHKEYAWYFKSLAYDQIPSSPMLDASQTKPADIGCVTPADEKMIAQLEEAIRR